MKSTPNDIDETTANPVRQRTIGERFLVVADVLRELFERAAAAEHLTVTEARVLRHLADDATENNLAAILGCLPPRVSRLLGSLEGKSMIVRAVAPHDRRVRLIELTPVGRAAADRIESALVAASPIELALTDAQQRQLVELLDAMGAAGAQIGMR